MPSGSSLMGFFICIKLYVAIVLFRITEQTIVMIQYAKTGIELTFLVL